MSSRSLPSPRWGSAVASTGIPVSVALRLFFPFLPRGIDDRLFNAWLHAQDPKVNRASIGHACGNAMSVPVMERLLGRRTIS